MPESLVAVSVVGSVGIVELADPDRRNILTAAMVRGIADAFNQLEASDDVTCVVVTGRGRAFCAGAERSTLERAAKGGFASVMEVYDGFLRVLHSPLPTIAAVNGPAVGAGFNLVLACDVRLASTAARFDTRFSTLRLHPGGGHTWLLEKAVGHQQATLATLFGQVWDADRALATGLVASVCEPDRRRWTRRNGSHLRSTPHRDPAPRAGERRPFDGAGGRDRGASMVGDSARLCGQCPGTAEGDPQPLSGLR